MFSKEPRRPDKERWDMTHYEPEFENEFEYRIPLLFQGNTWNKLPPTIDHVMFRQFMDNLYSINIYKSRHGCTSFKIDKMDWQSYPPLPDITINNSCKTLTGCCIDEHTLIFIRIDPSLRSYCDRDLFSDQIERTANVLTAFYKFQYDHYYNIYKALCRKHGTQFCNWNSLQSFLMNSQTYTDEWKHARHFYVKRGAFFDL